MKSICNAQLQRLRRKQRIPKIKSVCPNTRVGRVGASKSHHLTLRLPCIRMVVNQACSKYNLQEKDKSTSQNLPKIMRRFSRVEKPANINSHQQNSAEPSFLQKRVHTVYPAHGFEKHTHTHTLTQHVANACVQIKPESHQPPLSPPSTDCGRIEKGGENINGSPKWDFHINGIYPKRRTQIYLPIKIASTQLHRHD